ncbi:MAG: SDR family oxidoreductase [Actinobacteria bacterium]|nr:SDR family oxidoreductase [Actinomycetota bacterium]
MTDDPSTTRSGDAITRLDRRRILVTGAAQGLGEAIAARIVDLGGRVLIGDVLVAPGEATAERLGPAAGFVELDVTSPEGWDRAVRVADDELGGLDGLVNNAAILHLGLLEDMAPERLARLIEVNLVGPALGIRAVTPVLRSGGGGSIVNISSIAGLEGMNSTVAYSASKWGLRGLTRSSAIELGRDRIRVNTVCPGMGNPEMFTPFIGDFDLPLYLEKAPQVPYQEQGRPRNVDMHDVTEMVVWLLSDAARGCSGADFAVDAAWTAGKLAPGVPGFGR